MPKYYTPVSVLHLETPVWNKLNPWAMLQFPPRMHKAEAVCIGGGAGGVSDVHGFMKKSYLILIHKPIKKVYEKPFFLKHQEKCWAWSEEPDVFCYWLVFMMSSILFRNPWYFSNGLAGK